MASNSASLQRKRRGPYLQYLQTPNPLTAIPRRTRFRYLSGITRQSRKFSNFSFYCIGDNIATESTDNPVVAEVVFPARSKPTSSVRGGESQSEGSCYCVLEMHATRNACNEVHEKKCMQRGTV